MDQRTNWTTNGPVDHWTDGQLNQWITGPLDQWIIQWSSISLVHWAHFWCVMVVRGFSRLLKHVKVYISRPSII